MKKIIILILAAITLAGTLIAHPGRTDSKGGHYDRRTGSYHYHR